MRRKIVSLLLMLLFTLTNIDVFSEEITGQEGSFFGLTYKFAYDADNIIKPVNITENIFLENGPVKTAQIVKTALDKMPEGRRSIDIVLLINTTMKDGIKNHFFPGDNIKKTRELIESIFTELKKLDAKIDYVIDDYEEAYSLYAFENAAIAHFRSGSESIPDTIAKNGHLYEEYIKNILLEFQSDATYQEILRPKLDAAGFVFGKNYDLEYINIFPNAQEPRKTKFFESNPPPGAENSSVIFNECILENLLEGYNEGVFEPIKKLYPNIKFSNYGSVMQTASYPVWAHWGLPRRLSETDLETIIGTHASPVIYGGFYPAIRKERIPPGYPYEEFKATAFNVLLLPHQFLQNNLIVSARHGAGLMPWVGLKSWYDFFTGGLSHNSLGTNYYEEMMFHIGLFNPDPFLVFDTGGSEAKDIELFSRILKQLDEVAGFDDRTPVVPTIQTATKIDQRYILTGMKAGGRSIWRITPDLYTPGVSIESFLKSKSPLTFQIGNQFVEFPDGSYIYEPKEKLSEYGYWVIAPIGSTPKQYRDFNLPEPDEPVETEDGFPTGYLLEAKGTGKRAENAQQTNSEQPVEDQPVITDIVTQSIEIKPLNFEGSSIPLVTEQLPNDIKGHWAEDVMANLFALGIIRGTDRGLEPDRTLNLAEFLTMLMNAFGVTLEEYEGGLPELHKEAWYAKVAYTALKGQWITEADVNLLESNLTREKTALIYYEACGKLLPQTATQITFNDDYRISQSSKEAVSKLSSMGIIGGYPDGEFKPKETLTRAEAATMIEWFFIINRR